MNLRQWPSNGDYVMAVQDLEWCFADPELQSGLIKPGPILGVPECATGQNAIVFPVTCASRKLAVRCFTTPADEGQLRYEAYSNYFAKLICPPLVSAEWNEHGIQTGTGWWPIVKMEWISGRALQQVVADSLDDPGRLRLLAEDWRETVRLLRHAKIAHGDLQHGNVLVDDANSLRLVDYDGIWLPGLADLEPREVGHPNYQHPERVATRYWDEHIDAFSALAIYTSLRALAADPTLWQFHNGENLIFTSADYSDPTMTEVWRRVHASPDDDVVVFGDLLATACRTTVRIATDLDEILTTRRIPQGAPYPLAQVDESTPGVAGVKRPWWVHDYDEVPGSEPDYSAVRSDWSHKGGAWPDENVMPTIVPGEPSRTFDWRVAVIALLLTVAVAAAVIVLIIVGSR